MKHIEWQDAMRILRNMKEILCRDAGIKGHIVPEYIENEIDELMWQIFPKGSRSIFD